MNQLLSIIFLSTLQLVTFKSNCQIYTPSNESELQEISLKIFELYTLEELDTLITKYFPSKEMFLDLFEKLNIDEPKMLQVANDDFNKIINSYKQSIEAQMNAAKEHDINLPNLTIDSVTYLLKNDLSTEENLNVHFATVHCSDSGRNYLFEIHPLINFEGKWYLFNKNLGLKAKQD